jgi:hypothetical protein
VGRDLAKIYAEKAERLPTNETDLLEPIVVIPTDAGAWDVPVVATIREQLANVKVKPFTEATDRIRQAKAARAVDTEIFQIRSAQEYAQFT